MGLPLDVDGEIGIVGCDDVFDGRVEEAGQLECQGQAGVVLAGLQGIHRLARDNKLFREIGLRPVARCSQHLDPWLGLGWSVPDTLIVIAFLAVPAALTRRFLR
jgi:hypothetical protein